MKRACSTCEFAWWNSRDMDPRYVPGEYAQLECRRHGPTRRRKPGHLAGEPLYPEVAGAHWCGDWALRDGVAP